MTLQQLKYVSMVERCGSFSKAAQKLYVSQPSVSDLVHGLEEQAAPYGPPHPHPCRFPLLTITAADPPAVPEGLLRLDRKRSRTMITCVIRNVCY